MAGFVLRLLIAAFLTAPIDLLFDVAGAPIPWWASALISVVLVFGGWFFFINLDEVA